MADNIYDATASGSQAGVTLTDDGTGSDWLIITGTYSEESSIRLEWSVSGGVATQAMASFWNTPSTTKTLWVNGLIENAKGSDSDDWINGNTAHNILYGDNNESGVGGDDTVNGDEGHDTIFGGEGNDDVNGMEDNDLLFGNDGNDNVHGASGIDTVEGGAGADSISGGSDIGDTLSYTSSNAAVRVSLGLGWCTVSGGHAQGDSVYGFTDVIGSGFADVIVDSVKGFNGSNINLFLGEGGNDRMLLGGGNDTGLGGDGADQILGEDGNDQLSGGAAGDLLTGGLGRDRLTGDAGADRFIFAKATDSTLAVAGRDTIADFSRGQGDKIDLRAIDAKSGAGNQSFTFIGSAAFDGDKGDLRFVKSGAHVIVQGDINGDRKADFALLVEDMASLRVGDFLL
jgi:serralysin